MPREGITEKVTFKSRPQRLWENEPCRYLGKTVVRKGTAVDGGWSAICAGNKVASMTREVWRWDLRDENKIQSIEDLVDFPKNWITWSEIEIPGEFWHRAYMIWLLSKDLFFLHFNLIEKLPRNKLLGLKSLAYKRWSCQPCSIACDWFLFFSRW